MYSYLEKQPIYLSRLFHVYKILTFEFFFPSCTQNQNPSDIIQKTKIITIPLAICHASENSCLVEKFSSTSQGSSPDSCRFSIESGIAEAWFFPSRSVQFFMREKFSRIYLPTFIELYMEMQCWCPSRWSLTLRPETNRKMVHGVVLLKGKFISWGTP